MRIALGDIVDRFATYGSGYLGMGAIECQVAQDPQGNDVQICGELNLDPNQVIYGQGGQSTTGYIPGTNISYTAPAGPLPPTLDPSFIGPLPPPGFVPTCPAGTYPGPGNACLGLPATIQPTGMPPTTKKTVISNTTVVLVFAGLAAVVLLSGGRRR